MLKTSSLLFQRNPLRCQHVAGKFFASNYAIKEVRADYMLIVQDKEGDLQYMREIETQDGKQGIVLKLQNPSEAYVAMYEPFPFGSHLNIKKKNIPWQLSVEPLAQNILSKTNPGIFHINGTQSFKPEVSFEQQPSNSSSKLESLSPTLELCHDLHYGDMVQFSGCLGSGKTSTARDIARLFSSKGGHTALYINPSSEPDNKRAVENGSWALQAGYSKNQTDVGVYMLAAKATRLAKLLSSKGEEVLLTIDGIRHILQAEWHMVQILSNPVNNVRGEHSFRAPRLPPISTLNEIYSACSKRNEQKKKGSLSAIITTDNNNIDELMPEVTPYTNNLKHLNSLTKSISFPLTLRNSSVPRTRFIDGQQDMPNISHCVLDLRAKINSYLIEKRQTELKAQLYKSDMREAPWDYYQLLDAEWWMKGLQAYKPSSKADLDRTFRWIWLNIDLELEAHWKISCLQALKRFLQFAQKQELQMGKDAVTQFTQFARMEGWFSPFKRDYLA